MPEELYVDTPPTEYEILERLPSGRMVWMKKGTEEHEESKTKLIELTKVAYLKEQLPFMTEEQQVAAFISRGFHTRLPQGAHAEPFMDSVEVNLTTTANEIAELRRTYGGI